MIKAKFPTLYKRALYILTTVTWLTGTAFFYLNRFGMIEGDFGPEKHPWQFPMLMVHGACAFLMIFYFGFIMASHITITWKLKKHRGIGLVLASVVGFQIISAYLLYYLANENVRDVMANLHALIGFLMPVALTVHIVHAARLRRQRERKMMFY